MSKKISGAEYPLSKIFSSERWPLKIGQSVKVGCTSQIRSDTHEYHTTQTLFSRVQG